MQWILVFKRTLTGILCCVPLVFHFFFLFGAFLGLFGWVFLLPALSLLSRTCTVALLEMEPRHSVFLPPPGPLLERFHSIPTLCWQSSQAPPAEHSDPDFPSTWITQVWSPSPGDLLLALGSAPHHRPSLGVQNYPLTDAVNSVRSQEHSRLRT